MAKKSRLDVYMQFLESYEDIGHEGIEEAQSLINKYKAHKKNIHILDALLELGLIDAKKKRELKGKLARVLQDENIPTSEAMPVPKKETVGGLTGIISEAMPAELPAENTKPIFDEKKYQYESRLGNGAFGVVEKYTDTNLGIPVAVKQMIKRNITPERKARWLREQKAGIICRNNPRVARVLDRGYDSKGNLRLVMDFVEGQELRDIITEVQKGKTRKYPLQSMLEWIKEVALGLDQMHNDGVLHRDIKPENIMITTEGEAKIADLGLAKIKGEKDTKTRKNKRSKSPDLTDDAFLTAEGWALGTPPYMSPEQIETFSKTDKRADIYSLGATLYEILTGIPPHLVLDKNKDFDQTKTLKEIVDTDAIPPSQRKELLYSQIHPDLEAICMKALSKNLTGRYQTAKELADDIDRYLAREPVKARPRGIAEKLGNFAVNRPVLTALLAILLTGGTTSAFVIQGLQTAKATAEAQAQEQAKEKAEISAKLSSAKAKEEKRKRKEAEKENLELMADKFLTEAYTLAKAEQWEEAVEKYTEAIQYSPLDYRARGSRAIAYQSLATAQQNESEKRKYFQLANKDIEIAIKQKPERPDLRRTHARIQWQLGSMDEAEKIFHKAKTLDPKNLDLLADIATFYQNKPEAVIKICAEMLEINEEYTQAHVNLMNAYYALDKLEKAEEHARFLVNSRKLPNSWFYLSKILYHLAAEANNKPEARITYLKEAKERIEIALDICSEAEMEGCIEYAQHINKAYTHFVKKRRLK